MCQSDRGLTRVDLEKQVYEMVKTTSFQTVLEIHVLHRPVVAAA